MKAWGERLYIEREELMEKYEKLCHFINTSKTSISQTRLLAKQKVIMGQYIKVLDARIKDLI